MHCILNYPNHFMFVSYEGIREMLGAKEANTGDLGFIYFVTNGKVTWWLGSFLVQAYHITSDTHK